jgi:hypothetical protein
VAVAVAVAVAVRGGRGGGAGRALWRAAAAAHGRAAPQGGAQPAPAAAHPLEEEPGPADEVGQRLVGDDALRHRLAQLHRLGLLLLAHLQRPAVQQRRQLRDLLGAAGAWGGVGWGGVGWGGVGWVGVGWGEVGERRRSGRVQQPPGRAGPAPGPARRGAGPGHGHGLQGAAAAAGACAAAEEACPAAPPFAAHLVELGVALVGGVDKVLDLSLQAGGGRGRCEGGLAPGPTRRA